MNPAYNNEIYYDYIIKKYKNSVKHYKVVLTDNDNEPEKYLSLHESMNVYPIYPKPIIMPLKKSGEAYDIKIQLHDKKVINMEKTKASTDELNNKIIEYNSLISYVVKNKNKNKIKSELKVRRYFDYEIRDSVKNKLKNQNISNAWIKMYEILHTYNLFNTQNNTLDTFHICEHPGGFIHAIKYYIKNVLNKQHDFVFQSLKPESDPQIFKPDKELLIFFSI